MTLKIIQVFGFLMATLFCSQSIAQSIAPTTVTINDNTLQAKLNISSQISVDLVVEFENSIGLSADNIDILATLVDIDSATVLNRLNSSDISVLPSFPVIISISPKATSGFGFEGLASVEIYTKAVDYNAAMPARLFRSHANGDFEDITSMVSAGSIRARGNTGSFSDFMILLDQRSDAQMIADTFSQLEHLFNTNNDLLSPVLASSMQTSLTTLQNALFTANYNSALIVTETLIGLVETASNEQISTVWRSTNDLVNMKGELLTRLKTLRYSLRVI